MQSVFIRNFHVTKMRFYLFLLVIDQATSSSELCDHCTCLISAYSAFCSGANLTSLPSEIDVEDLHVIDLSDNMLTSIEPEVIVRRSRNTLQQLALRNNMIEELSTTVFSGMSRLSDLDMSWNSIVTSLELLHFRDVISLDYLSLAHNEIKCIKANAFVNLNKLTELDLSYNRLTSSSDEMTSCFPRGAICSLKSLIVLRISSNYLPGLFQGLNNGSFFSCLTKLTNLQASNCGIKTLTRHAFAGLDHVTSLDLSDNSISSWPSGTLSNARSLVYLDLGQNLLSNLPSDFVQGCPNLAHLGLRNNEIRSLDVNWVEKLMPYSAQLTSLKLNEAIRRLESFLSSPVSDTATNFTVNTRDLYIDWSGNPWQCDCKILSFAGWVISEGSWLANVDGYHDVICYDPAHHRGSALFDVYVTGMIDRHTVMTLMSQCAQESSTAINQATSSTDTTSVKSTTEVTTTMLKTRSTNAQHKTTSVKAALTTALNLKSNGRTDSDFEYLVEEDSKVKVTTIILLCLVADLVVSVGLVFFIRKRCLRKRGPGKWATVVPATSSSLPPNREQNNDAELTPVNM